MSSVNIHSNNSITEKLNEILRNTCNMHLYYTKYICNHRHILQGWSYFLKEKHISHEKNRFRTFVYIYL